MNTFSPFAIDTLLVTNMLNDYHIIVCTSSFIY